MKICSIHIEKLSIKASIGCLPYEKQQRQSVLIDLIASIPAEDAAKSDEISDTVSYAEVLEAIKVIVNSQHFNLVEHLAERIHHHLSESYPLSIRLLKIMKPHAISQCQAVGYSIEAL